MQGYEKMNVFNNFAQIAPQTSVLTGTVKSTNSIQSKKDEYKPDVLDFLSEKVVNKNDLNDMVKTPRAIFKGYLCFTVGTTINAISSLIKNEKVKKGLAIAGSLTSIYGTYNFVKPYLIRNKELTKNEK